MQPHPVLPALSRRRFGALFGSAALLAATRTAKAAPAVERSVKVAPGLYELVVSTTTNLLHVASAGPRGSNTAAVIGLDLQTLEQRSSIALGSEGVFGLAVNNRTGMLYGTGTRAGQLVAMDLRAGTVKSRIVQGEGAHLRQPLVDEAGNRVFVTEFGARDKPSAIWIFDGAAGQVSTVIRDGLEGGITGLAHDPARNRLFATALARNEIVEISLERNAVVRRFASGGEAPVNLAFDAAGGRLFCTNQKTGQLSVLDAAAGTVVKVLDTGAGALGVTLSADGRMAYVANRGAGTVSLVDTAKLEVMASLPTGTHPNTVAVDGRSGLAYVSNKAKTGERGAPPPEDPNGDTVSLIKV